jgi:hypothetical protein
MITVVASLRYHPRDKAPKLAAAALARCFRCMMVQHAPLPFWPKGHHASEKLKFRMSWWA